jgi:hypothetical protein
MGQLLHGSARTTAAVRRAIQHSQESTAKLAGHSGLNPKTITKWKKRAHVHDAPMGPKQRHSIVLEDIKDSIEDFAFGYFSGRPPGLAAGTKC